MDVAQSASAEGATKRCTKCGEVKPFTAYGKHHRGAFGLRSECKECKKQIDLKYVSENREFTKERLRRWYSEHRESQIEKSKKAARDNWPRTLQYARNYYARKIDNEQFEVFMDRMMKEAEGESDA